MKKLQRDFYNRDTILVAKELLGKTITRVINNVSLECIITEVEAYTGIDDKACHTYGGKRTKKTEVMWGKEGHAYVYIIYGMYCCLNVVTEEEGNPCAVLIRGVVPKKNISKMCEYRYNKEYKDLTKYQIKNFSNGPGKLCKALNIDKSQNGFDLLGDELYISEGILVNNKDILIGKRINIDYAEEAKDYLWRFYINIENIKE
jgi:DNA-3-methyladenine glycosylase